MAEGCYSGFIQNNTCWPAPISKFKGRPCSRDQDCILLDSNKTEVGYSQCPCSFNGGGFTYCSLSQGDPEFRLIWRNFQFVLQRNWDCHTKARYGPCKYLDSAEYIAYQKSKLYFEQYPSLVFNDPCIKNIFTYEYWNLHSSLLQLQIVITLFLMFLH